MRIGNLVRFAHEKDGGPVHRVASVMADGMIELHDMGGYFAPHLFVAADDIGDIPQPEKQIRGPVSGETQKNMVAAQRKRREREAAGIPVNGEKISALMLRNGIATGHGDTLDDLLGELEAWLSRYRIERNDQDRALADAIRETASCADELAFWRFQAIYHRALILRGKPMPGDVLMLEGSRVWREAEKQLEKHREDENRERYAHAEAPRDPGGA